MSEVMGPLYALLRYEFPHRCPVTHTTLEEMHLPSVISASSVDDPPPSSNLPCVPNTLAASSRLSQGRLPFAVAQASHIQLTQHPCRYCLCKHCVGNGVGKHKIGTEPYEGFP
jgi:hypothetical protein